MLERVIAAVCESRKYAAIDERVIRRVCADACRRYPKWKDAAKAAKNELHIMHESYLVQNGFRAANALLDAGEITPETVRALLQLHASTRERAAYVDAVCAWVSQYYSAGDTLCDVGCGFNPFALPLYSVRPAAYYAYDISLESAALMNRFFAMTGGNYHAEILDAAADVPPVHANLLLAYKLLPLLEQQKKGRAGAFLAAADFDRAVISFPLKSLSGKERGMGTHYAAFFAEILPETCRVTAEETIGNELFYAIERTYPRIPDAT